MTKAIEQNHLKLVEAMTAIESRGLKAMLDAKQAIGNDDAEAMHIVYDVVLTNVLLELGLKKLVAEYNNINKYYT